MKEEVSIPYKNGFIQGTLYNPSAKTLVIISPGYMITRGSPRFAQDTKDLAERGYAVFIYDPHSWTTKNWYEFLFVDLEKITHELEIILDFLQKDKQYTQTILLGLSLGAYSASTLAMKHVNIDALVTVNGFLNFHTWYNQHMIIRILYKMPFITRLYKRNHTFENNYFHPEKITVPTLVICGTADIILSSKISHEFYKRVGTTKKTFHLVSGLPHLPRDSKTITRVTNIVHQWIQHVIHEKKIRVAKT